MKIKISLALLLCMFISSSGFSQEQVKFTSGSFQDVLSLAKAENKIIMADFFTDWCIWCVELDKKVYHNEDAAKYMNENQINWKTDAEKGEGVELAKKYEINGFPTIIFMDSDGKEIDRIVGYFPTASFMKIVKDINERKNLLSDFISAYNRNPKGLEENYLLGKKYFDIGDMENAMKYISFVLSTADKNSDMYTDCLLKNAAIEGNTKILSDYIKNEPSGKFTKDAYINLADLTYGKEKNFEAAEDLYQVALKKFPSDEDVAFSYALFVRGKIYSITSDSNVSVDERISSAEKLYSDNLQYLEGATLEASIRARLANLYLNAGDKDNALKNIDKAISIFDNKNYRDLRNKIISSN